MRRLPEPPDLVNRKTCALWLVICLSMLPMTVPVFSALSGSQSAPANVQSLVTINEDRVSARPLKAEVVDNTPVSPARLDALGGSISATPDVILPLLAVFYIACLGWRFTLRHQVRQ